MDPSVHAATLALKRFGAERVLLFGSFARGTWSPKSDIDLICDGVPDDQFFEAMAAASRAAGRFVDLVPLDAISGNQRYAALVEEAVDCPI